jgi:hypothetical protein
MLKTFVLSHLKIDILVARVLRDLYKVMLVAVYFAILLGLFGSFLLILNPSIDDEIAQAIVKSLISKYDSLDSSQKNRIQIIFSEIFIQK